MRPAKHLGDRRGLAAVSLVQRAKPSIAVGMQEAAEAGQVALRLLALAVGRVAIDDRRRRRSGVGALVTQIDS
jgi:hypothetical protein